MRLGSGRIGCDLLTSGVMYSHGAMAHEIIGRQEALLALDEFLDAVPMSGAALVFEGDAGIGKTVLWHEGVRRAREREYRVMTARSTESELQVAFATIGDLLAPVIAEVLPQLGTGSTARARGCATDTGA